MGWEGARKMRQVGQGREVRGGGKDQGELAYKDENVMMKPTTLYVKFKNIYKKWLTMGSIKVSTHTLLTLLSFKVLLGKDLGS